MSYWRKSESACPTDPVNNPEREGDRLLSTAIYFSCRLITSLLYFPSARSCKRTNPRLFAPPLFSSKYCYRKDTHDNLTPLWSFFCPLTEFSAVHIPYPYIHQSPDTHHSIADCGQAQIFSITKAARRYSADRYKKKIYKDGEFAKRGPYNYN